MASWAKLQQEFNAVAPPLRGGWLTKRWEDGLKALSQHVGRPVIFYASGWLQKPQVDGAFLSIAHDDVNAFMSCVHGLDCTKGLLLMLHTPGGSAEAAETIVDYLRSKFTAIDVLVPTYAMSAGTMIALAADRIVMGRQSQLGPTDPQLIMNGMAFSAHSIDETFDEAKKEILKDPGVAAAYVPVLQPFGPALLQEARKAAKYGESLVAKWLAAYMLTGEQDPEAAARRVAAFFGGAAHGSHGRRIRMSEVHSQGLNVDELESDPVLQDAALTVYHLVTLAFENGPACKLVVSTNGTNWVKNIAGVPASPMPFPFPFPFPLPNPLANPAAPAPAVPSLAAAPAPAAPTPPTTAGPSAP